MNPKEQLSAFFETLNPEDREMVEDELEKTFGDLEKQLKSITEVLESALSNT